MNCPSGCVPRSRRRVTTVALLPDTRQPLVARDGSGAFADILDGRAEDEAIAPF